MRRPLFGWMLAVLLAFVVGYGVDHSLVLARSSSEPRGTEDGTADLEKATDLKLAAASIRDLEQVIRLCDSAIAAGLDDESKSFANQLLSGTLIEVAQRYSEPILQPGNADPRWPFLRQQAVLRLDRAVEIAPENATAHLLRAQLLILPEGDKEKAKVSLDKAMELLADDMRQLSQCYVISAGLTDDEEEKLAAFNRAIELFDQNVDAIRSRALMHLLAQRTDEALADFRRLTEIDSTDLMAQQAIAEVLANGEKFDEAMAAIESAIEADPTAAANYMIRARIHVLQDHVDDAINDLTKALELQPDEIPGLLMRAELLMQAERLPEARADIDRALIVRPGLIRGILLRSLISAAEGKFASAATDLELLVQSDPENTPWQLQLAMMYSADDRPTKAVELYDSILKKDPKNFFAIRGKADAMLTTGNHEAAVSLYTECLAVEPEDDHVLNNLAWVLATSPRDEVRDGARSVELGLKACEITEYKEAHILSTLAAGYAETGDWDKAVEFATKAVEAVQEGDNAENLQKELDSYKEKKPWRELQVEEKDPNKPNTLDF